jgi:hypothetical protein
MPELTTDFQSLPEEYQRVIQAAQDRHRISVAPLQLLVGGWSGAVESVLQVTGGAWWPADRVEVEANQEIIRSALSEAEHSAAQKRGRQMTLEQALTFASE